MHDALGVSGIERVSDLDGQVNQTVGFERAAEYRFP